MKDIKKYKIKFTADYLEYEEWANDGDEFWESRVKDNPDELERCKKWRNKEISIMDLEGLVDEVGAIIFDGATIEVYNDWRE